MIFSWGFIGNGRNVSICSPVARRGSTADRVDWQGRLRVTALRQSVLRQTIFKQGQHYNKPEGPADPAGPTDKPTNMQKSRTGPTDNISEARPTVRCLLVFASWGSSVSRAHRPPTSSPTPTTSTTPPTPPPLVQPRPAGTKHRQRTPAAPSLVGTDSC